MKETDREDRALLERFKYPILMLIAGVMLAGVAVLLWRRPEPATITVLAPGPTPIPSSTPTPGPYQVYVTGEVMQPETAVSVPAGSRVQDAIEAAGGVTASADLSGVNLSQILNDGDMVYVPPLDREAALTPTPNHPAFVHINSATVEELEMLPGIGPSLAQAIVDYRDEHGLFTSLDDLDNVPGMGPAKLDAIRDLIVFDVPSRPNDLRRQNITPTPTVIGPGDG